MTIVAALHVPEVGTVIASDTQYTSSGWRGYDSRGKWLLGGGWALGVTGELKTFNIIEQHKNLILDASLSPFQVSQQIFETLDNAEYEFETGDSCGYKGIHSSFLLANSEGVWEIDHTGAVFPVSSGECATTGSGMMYALGAFFATDPEALPTDRVRTALSAAMKYEPACGGEIWMMIVANSTIAATVTAAAAKGPKTARAKKSNVSVAE